MTKTDDKIKDLLKSSNLKDRLIGCYLAHNEGWGTLDIFDELKPIVSYVEVWLSVDGSGEKKTYQVGNFWAIVTQAFENKTLYIIGYNKEKLHTFGAKSKSSKDKKNFRKFKQYFIEHVLNDLP